MKPREIEYPIITCKFCSDVQEAYYVDEVKDKMVKKSLCFNCLFWFEKVETKNDPTHCVVKDRIGITHYTYFPDIPGNGLAMRGFGGTKFKIQFDDGRIVETKNLWCQGEVPEIFQDLLPINAKFLYCKDGMTWTGTKDDE